MTYPRQLQVSLKDTPYYHCIARCVRRAWLWGYDESVTGHPPDSVHFCTNAQLPALD